MESPCALEGNQWGGVGWGSNWLYHERGNFKRLFGNSTYIKHFWTICRCRNYPSIQEICAKVKVCSGSYEFLCSWQVSYSSVCESPCVCPALPSVWDVKAIWGRVYLPVQRFSPRWTQSVLGITVLGHVSSSVSILLNGRLKDPQGFAQPLSLLWMLKRDRSWIWNEQGEDRPRGGLRLSGSSAVSVVISLFEQRHTCIFRNYAAVRLCFKEGGETGHLRDRQLGIKIPLSLVEDNGWTLPFRLTLGSLAVSHLSQTKPHFLSTVQLI